MEDKIEELRSQLRKCPTGMGKCGCSCVLRLRTGSSPSCRGCISTNVPVEPNNPPRHCCTAHSCLCVSACSSLCIMCNCASMRLCMLDLNDNRGTDPERCFTAATLFLTQKLSPLVRLPPLSPSLLSVPLMFTRVP